MFQVHTIFESGAWRNRVDGLQQGAAHPTSSAATAAGRAIAQELRGVHVVHDFDGVVVEQHRYGPPQRRRWVDPVRYQS